MSSPSDKVWIFVKGRRSFKWKGSDLCPFHKSRLLLLSKGRYQKLRWANPFWSVAYCKKTVKFMQWTVIFPVQHPAPLFSIHPAPLTPGGAFRQEGWPPSPPSPGRAPCWPARARSFWGVCMWRKHRLWPGPASFCWGRPHTGITLWLLCSDPLSPWASVPSKSAFQPSVKLRNPTSFQ